MRRHLVVGVLLVALAAYTVAVYAHAHGAILSLLSDDAYYYFVIAKNVLAGRGFTFDGIAPTNGFHPLWMGVVLAVFGLAGGGDSTPLVVVLLMGGVIATATLFLIHRIVERHVAQGYGIVALSAALLPNILTAALNGLETGLQLLLSVVLVGACYRIALLDPAAPPRRAALLGLLIGLVTLARLDSVFLVAAALLMGAFGWRRSPVRDALARAVSLGTGFAIVVVPYLAWNVFSFGHLMPSSSVSKSTFPHLAGNIALSGDKFWGFLMLCALWGLIAFTQVVARRRAAGSVPAFRTSPVSMIAIASTFHFLHVFLFMAWGVFWWHFTLYGLGIVFALPAAMAAMAGSRARTGRVLTAVAAALLVTLAAWSKFRELPSKAGQHAGWLEAARWARDETQPGDVFALADAGLFAYFSHRPVVNLDGKANSYEYLRNVEAGTVPQYLASVGARYVASTRVHYNQVGACWLAIPSPQPLVMERGWEVYRGKEIPTGLSRVGKAATSHFVVWELPEGYGR